MSRTNSSAGRLGGTEGTRVPQSARGHWAAFQRVPRPHCSAAPSSGVRNSIPTSVRRGQAPWCMLGCALTRYPNYKAFPLPCARRAAFFSRLRAARSLRCFAWIFLRRESVILGIGIILFLGPIQGRLCCHAVGVGECAIDSRRAAMNTRCRRAYARRTPRNTPSTPLLRQRACHTLKPFPARRSAMPRLYQTVASGYIALP
jgi:hypothetical protein